MNFSSPNTSALQNRIVVAMSGGVDSSVAAALMKQQGHDVIGITLQLYDHGATLQKKGACCAGQDIHDAKRVAEHIGIPHYVLNYENRFRESVIEDFAESYIRGETPIPCVRCNQTVKFHDLMAIAKQLGASALVTGHYIRRIETPQGPELHRATHTEKDQSYFLFATTKEQLGFLRFPLGEMEKTHIRELAQQFGLPVATKPDSQDICFIPNGNYAKVIEKLRPEAYQPGEIVHLNGKVMGTHHGIANFTIGQSRGLGLGHHEKLYVIKLEADSNRVIIGPKEALSASTLTIKEVNWLGHQPIDAEGMEVEVKLRSLHIPVPAIIHRTNTDRVLNVILPTPQNAITPGQACVIYKGTHMLGGGWITRDHQENIKIAA